MLPRGNNRARNWFGVSRGLGKGSRWCEHDDQGHMPALQNGTCLARGRSQRSVSHSRPTEQQCPLDGCSLARQDISGGVGVRSAAEADAMVKLGADVTLAPTLGVGSLGVQMNIVPPLSRHVHALNPLPSGLHTWLDGQPPTPVQAIDCPGTQRTSAADSAQTQGPKPVPSLLQTWFVKHPPGPTHATDFPETHAFKRGEPVLVSSEEGAVSARSGTLSSPLPGVALPQATNARIATVAEIGSGAWYVRMSPRLSVSRPDGPDRRRATRPQGDHTRSVLRFRSEVHPAPSIDRTPRELPGNPRPRRGSSARSSARRGVLTWASKRAWS